MAHTYIIDMTLDFMQAGQVRVTMGRMFMSKSKAPWFAGILVIILGTCAWFYLGGTGDGNERSGRRQAPEFVLKDHLNHDHTLQEMRGKLVIVHFWASWCPPCLKEIPDLIEFAEAWQDKPIEILAVSLDENWENAEKVVVSSKLPKNFISTLDLSGKVPEAYGTYQYPETYLLDGEGKIIVKWVGGQPWSSPGMQKALLEALNHLKS
jgi:thiol-disulfide isomerase/thioredoxin